MTRRDFMLMAICFALIFVAAFTIARVRSRRARAHTQAVVCQTRLRQLVLALRFYVQDYDGRFPPRAGLARQALSPYLVGRQAWLCPADPDRAASALRSSYEFNPALSGRQAGKSSPVWAFRDRGPWHQGRRQVVALDGRLLSEW